MSWQGSERDYCIAEAHGLGKPGNAPPRKEREQGGNLGHPGCCPAKCEGKPWPCERCPFRGEDGE